MPIFSDIFIFQVKCRVIKITTGPNPFTNSNQFFLKLLFKSQFSHIMVIWQVFNHQTFTGYFSNLLWSLLEMSSGTIHVQFVYNLRKFTNNLMPCFGLIDKKKQSSVIITSLIRTDTNQMKAKKMTMTWYALCFPAIFLLSLIQHPHLYCGAFIFEISLSFFSISYFRWSLWRMPECAIRGYARIYKWENCYWTSKWSINILIKNDLASWKYWPHALSKPD